MKLYGVYQVYEGTELKLEVLEVKKETDKSYILEKFAFSYGHIKRIPKDHQMLAFSSAAAVGKFLSHCERKITDYESGIKTLNRDIRNAQELLKDE